MANPVRSIVRSFEKLAFEERKEALEHLQAAYELARAARRAVFWRLSSTGEVRAVPRKDGKVPQ